MIRHYLKSAEAQSKLRTRSAFLTVIGETAYMTVIPTLPIDPQSTARQQAEQCFQGIDERLAHVGSDKSKIAHVTIWLADAADFDDVTAAWNAWIHPDHPPARACAQVNIINQAIKVEMIVVAQVPNGAPAD